jgi:glycosyltransferase involved in cell wall biosynthesis
MPFHNAENFITESIMSIINQTYKKWELILVDDGSTDNSRLVVSRLARSDPRFKIITLPTNKGLAHCRNLICEAASGAYLAWNDADDVSLRHRLSYQTQFALNDPDTAIFGSATYLLHESTQRVKRRLLPSNHGSIVCNIPFFNPISLNTVFMRNDVYSDSSLCYRDDMGPSSDYDFLGRAVANYRARNSPKLTATYRIHPQQMSQIDVDKLEHSTFDIQEWFLNNYFGILLSTNQKQIHQALFSNRYLQASNISDDDVLTYLSFLGNSATRCQSLEETWRQILRRRWLIHLIRRQEPGNMAKRVFSYHGPIELFTSCKNEIRDRIEFLLVNR